LREREKKETKYFASKTVEAKSTEKDLIVYEMENLQPCTAYTVFMRSGSETEMSVDQTAFVYFTKHADFIQLGAFADYHQVSDSNDFIVDYPAMFVLGLTFLQLQLHLKILFNKIMLRIKKYKKKPFIKSLSNFNHFKIVLRTILI
jgi:hypothetical protein